MLIVRVSAQGIPKLCFSVKQWLYFTVVLQLKTMYLVMYRYTAAGGGLCCRLVPRDDHTLSFCAVSPHFSPSLLSPLPSPPLMKTSPLPPNNSLAEANSGALQEPPQSSQWPCCVIHIWRVSPVTSYWHNILTQFYGTLCSRQTGIDDRSGTYCW